MYAPLFPKYYVVDLIFILTSEQQQQKSELFAAHTNYQAGLYPSIKDGSAICDLISEKTSCQRSINF